MLKRKLSRLKFHIDYIKIGKYLLAFVLSIGVIAFVGTVLLKVSIDQTFSPKIINNISNIPQTRVAIVFGAGLSNNGSEPSVILEDRVLAAVDLYKAGKVDKILMSGDSSIGHNESKIMMETAIKNGVKEFDLQPDYSGDRTYDTCYRAKNVFGINKAILVTQMYHLPRALYTCSSMGIEVYGYAADRHIYAGINDYTLREYPATFLAFWQLNIIAPDVTTGDKVNF